MFKTILLVLIISVSTCFAVEQDGNETNNIYDAYDYGFTDGLRCMMKEMKHFLDDTQSVSKEEFILRVEQCRQECKKEILEKIYGD